RPLVPLAFDEDQGVLRVSAPNRFKLDWVRKNFSHQIESLASEWFSRPVTVAFELPSSAGGRSATAMPRPAPTDGAAANNSGSSPAAPAQTVAAQTAAATSAPTPAAAAASATAEALHDRSRLNVELRFDNFVTGKANQLARA